MNMHCSYSVHSTLKHLQLLLHLKVHKHVFSMAADSKFTWVHISHNMYFLNTYTAAEHDKREQDGSDLEDDNHRPWDAQQVTT